MVPSATFLKALDAIALTLRRQDVKLVVCGVPERFRQLVRRTGRLSHLGEDDIVAATSKLQEALDLAYAHAETVRLGTTSADDPRVG
ncbi:hypothetical protein [Microbacterium atlanticum]|uniref:hypothetical protein n=1 Tax=Microbacterium atlanticum TaxID=2782168 RepID=UPI0018895B2C|nr:hypothetical protein [Microbacterium atlanticum]